MAMQAAKSIKPEAVRDALAAADYETFYARIKFTPDGDGDAIIMGGMIGQVQKGKLEIVFPRGRQVGDADLPGAAVGQEGVSAADHASSRMNLIAQTLADGLVLGGIYALAAVGFSLIFGVLHVINLSHGILVLIGAYLALIFSEALQHRSAAHHPAGDGRAVLRRLRLSALPDPARRRPRRRSTPCC